MHCAPCSLNTEKITPNTTTHNNTCTNTYFVLVLLLLYHTFEDKTKTRQDGNTIYPYMLHTARGIICTTVQQWPSLAHDEIRQNHTHGELFITTHPVGGAPNVSRRARRTHVSYPIVVQQRLPLYRMHVKKQIRTYSKYHGEVQPSKVQQFSDCCTP